MWGERLIYDACCHSETDSFEHSIAVCSGQSKPLLHGSLFVASVSHTQTNLSRSPCPSSSDPITQLTILYSNHYYERRGKHGEPQEPQGHGHSSYQRKTLEERISQTKLSCSFANQRFNHRRDVVIQIPQEKQLR